MIAFKSTFRLASLCLVCWTAQAATYDVAIDDLLAEKSELKTLQGKESIEQPEALQQPKSRTNTRAQQRQDLNAESDWQIEQLMQSRERSAAFVLRCWQEGRLILQRNVSRLPDAASNAVQIDDDQATAMHLFDLKNAMCTVQRRETKAAK
jgi:hypothetical protein